MTFPAIIETFPFFLWGGVCFLLSRFSEFLIFLSEGLIGFLVHFVGMSFGFFLLEVGVLIVPFIFLGSFSEVIVEARRRRD
jgi:hypothetical protein